MRNNAGFNFWVAFHRSSWILKPIQREGCTNESPNVPPEHPPARSAALIYACLLAFISSHFNPNSLRASPCSSGIFQDYIGRSLKIQNQKTRSKQITLLRGRYFKWAFKTFPFHTCHRSANNTTRMAVALGGGGTGKTCSTYSRQL